MADVYGRAAGFPEADGASTLASVIDRGRLGGAFCDLHRQKFTGLVRIESDERSASVGFRAGQPVCIEDSGSRSTLGDELISRAVITRAQYAAVIARVTEGLVEHEDLAFCEHAVALGYLSEERAGSEASDRTRTQLIQAFAMRDCQWTLEEGEDALFGQGDYPQELGAIVYMGVRTFYDEALLRGYVPEPARSYMRLTAPAASIGEFFGLDEDELKLLRAIDPESTIEHLVGASIVDTGHALALIALLRVARLGEFSGAPFERERSGARPSPTAPRSASRTGMNAVRPGSQTGMPAVTVRPASRSASQTNLPAANTAQTIRAPSQTGMPAQTSHARATPATSAPIATAARTVRAPSQTGVRAMPAAQSQLPATEAASRSPAAHGGGRSAFTNPGNVPDATQEALREAAARASRGKTAARPVAPRSGHEAEAANPSSQSSQARPAVQAGEPTTKADPAQRAEYAKAHLNELMQRRRNAQPQSSDQIPAVKRDPARDLRRAQDLLREQHYARAEEILQTLVEREPTNDMFRAYHLWAKFRSQPELDDSQTGELMDHAKKLIQLPEHAAFACYVLGHLYMAAKKDELAEKYFRRAHTADKSNKDAERHLLILERRKQQAAETEATNNRKIFGIHIAGNKPKV